MTARRTNLLERPTYEGVARLIKRDAPLWLNSHLEWWAQGMYADRLKEESQPTKSQMRDRLLALQKASELIERELGSTSMREVLAIDLRGPLKYVSNLPFMLRGLAGYVEFVRTSSGLTQKDGTTKRGRNKANGPLSARPFGSGKRAFRIGGVLPLGRARRPGWDRDLLHEREKSPNLCRRQMPGRMVGIKRIAFVGPWGQDLHEFSVRERGSESDRQFLKHTLAGNACRDRG
jgi:hypothetical protein